VIPVEAVEAAWESLWNSGVDDRPATREELRRALEAAAPYMLRDAWESGWANARGNYMALYNGQEIPNWITLRNPYG
jgi:hypothetical protein